MARMVWSASRERALGSPGTYAQLHRPGTARRLRAPAEAAPSRPRSGFRRVRDAYEFMRRVCVRDDALAPAAENRPAPEKPAAAYLYAGNSAAVPILRMPRSSRRRPSLLKRNPNRGPRSRRPHRMAAPRPFHPLPRQLERSGRASRELPSSARRPRRPAGHFRNA